MALYPCRWPKGGRADVWAANKAEAIDVLDGVDNAVGCHPTALRDLLVHLRLSDWGRLSTGVLGRGAKGTNEKNASAVNASLQYNLSDSAVKQETRANP